MFCLSINYSGPILLDFMRLKRSKILLEIPHRTGKVYFELQRRARPHDRAIRAPFD